MRARAWWTLLVAGAAAVAAGLLWGSWFAGVPYQDATAEQTARFEWHAAFASWLLLGGALSLAVSIIGLVRHRKRGPPSP